MRLDKFAGPWDIDPEDLVRLLTRQVELPRGEAEELVGQLNARLQDTMQYVAARLDERELPAELIKGLVDDGWSHEQAVRFVEHTGRELKNLSTSADGLDQLLARSRRRMVAYGPILYDVILFCHSAYRWSRQKHQRSKTADI